MDNKPEGENTNTNQAPVNNNPVPTPVTPQEMPTSSNTTPNATESELEFSEKTIMAALSYVGPLVFIPLLVKKDDPFTLFHIKQGLVLFGIEAVIWVLQEFMFGMMYSSGLWSILGLINLVLLVLSILGIYNVLKKTEKEIPVLGKFSSYIKL